MTLNDEIKKKIIAESETNYKDFSSGLIPGCKNMYGVRIPVLRDMAKNIAKGDWQKYLDEAEDASFEEIMLQGLVIGYVKADIKIIINYMHRFIPKIDNWSVNDSFCTTLKITKKYMNEMWNFMMQYINSEDEYQMRFVAVMMMDYYLTDEYIDRVLYECDELMDIWQKKEKNLIKSGISIDLATGYYLRMGIAWTVATAYAFYPEQTMCYLNNNKLDDITYNKSIQKMIESYRVTKEDKIILRSMKKKYR